MILKSGGLVVIGIVIMQLNFMAIPTSLLFRRIFCAHNSYKVIST